MILNAKKQSTTNNGKRKNPNDLSNRNEKNTPNFAMSFNMKILPNIYINPIFRIKNNATIPIK